MERHLTRNLTRRSKRPSNMNELFLSPSLHHIHHRKQARLIKQEALNQNRSMSPTHIHQQFQTKNIYSSSYTSLNSYLKEFNLSEKDFFELRQALKTIFHYLQPKTLSNQKEFFQQRLTSPYIQKQLNNDDQSLLPLYTNEYFIRNGLLNHNDGPDFQSMNLCYSNPSKPFMNLQSYLLSCHSSSSSSSIMLRSSMNISLPLTLLSNKNYLFTALTSNFTSEKSKRSQSNMELNMMKYHNKSNNDDETESIMIRRNKVKIWERDNILQQKMSVSHSSRQQDGQLQAFQYHRSSTIRTSSTNNEDKTMKMTEESSINKNISLQTSSNIETNKKLVEIKNIDDLFPMIKVLAPYIIIRDSFPLNSTNNCTKVFNNNYNNAKHIPHVTGLEKQSFNYVLNPTLTTTQQWLHYLPTSSINNKSHLTNNDKPVRQQQYKKNYLLAEFDSVLTQISKK